MLIGIELKPDPVLVLSAAVLVLVIERGIHALGSSITKNSTCIGWQLTTWRRRFGSRRTDPALDYEHEHEHEWLSRQLAVGSNTYFSNGTKSKPFANQQSSVAIHQSNRESRKQTRNARSDTGRKIPTLRQSAIISRHSSIQSREPQANQKRPHRHRALNPNPSPTKRPFGPSGRCCVRPFSRAEWSTVEDLGPFEQ